MDIHPQVVYQDSFWFQHKNGNMGVQKFDATLEYRQYVGVDLVVNDPDAWRKVS